ncbi:MULTISPECIES: DUF262 domain-containing protein [Bacillus]|uniref:DUF262 domain-containing protein n=1 Tax=Bacillus TaxID=1386 RepID=UPI0014448EAC|nr:DUF262 domain-containing protein [Bacillus cereus]MDA1810961.1 DUF262 domain-containing HNH endonuclease family protein [Bacillus cereus]NKW86401.1 DUF262 domain-containing protein [Bacillus cereus]
MIEIRDYFVAKEHNIRTILTDGNRALKVPDYQRNFAWTNEELSQFWDDFKNAYENAFNPDFTQKLSAKPHFFGTILLTESNTNTNEFEITDGQQRLTVSTIFLRALLEISFRLKNPTEQSGIATMIIPLIQRNDYGESFEQRLYLDNTVNEVYTEYIINSKDQMERDNYLRLHPIKIQTPPSSSQRLKEAYDFFLEKLSKEFSDELSQYHLHEQLKCYIKAFSRLFTLLEIRVKNRETAYTIFGTINKRGKGLTDSDIIKNEIFKSVKEHRRHEIKEKWDSIIDSIDTEDLTDYLRFQYASIYGPVKKVDLFRVITQLLTEVDPITYLDQLKIEADWYARVNLIGATHWNNNITKKLEAFKSLDVSHSIPLLLTGAVLYNNNEHEFERLVNATLVFCLRYFTIGRTSVENLEREIGNMSKSLRDGTRDLNSTISYMHSLTTDQEFSHDFSIFATKSSAVAFYLLNQLEINRMSGVVPLPHGPSQHIEHIMPKKPSKARTRLSEWSHVRDNPEYKDYVHRLGNMLILESDINQSVGNKDFNNKKNLYHNSGLSYPRDISATYTIWDFANIQNRQHRLATEALAIWRYY